MSCSKTLWQLERILIDTSLLFWAPSWKTGPHRLIYPPSAVSVLRSPELICQSAQPAWPRFEVSFISRPPHCTNIRGPYLPGTHVPPRPSGEPVQKHIRSVHSDQNEALSVTVWSTQVLFCNDRHGVAVRSCAWFFLHYCVRMSLNAEQFTLRMIDRVVRKSTFLIFFIFFPLFMPPLWWRHPGLD